MTGHHSWKVTFTAFRSAVIVWSFVAIGNTSAELMHTFDLEEMVRSSDTIVIARTEVAPLAAPDGTSRLNLVVLQTIMGADTPAAVSFTFAPRRIQGLVSVGTAVASTRIIFLKHQNGDLQLSNVEYDMLPALNIPPPAGLDALGAVIAEEGEVIGSPNSSESDKIQAIDQLGRCKDLRTIPALDRGLSGTSEVVRLEAVSRLAIKGDLNAISIAQSTLLAPPPSLLDRVIHNLQVGIREGARTAATAPEVAKLLQVSDKATREAAANALSHVGSSSIIGPLRQALSDPDPEVRYFAVIGLANVTGDRAHLPNRIDFRLNEDKFTTYWRQWQPPE